MRISTEEIRRLEQLAVQDYCIPSLLLMENAGRSVSDVIFREYTPCKVLIFAGKGNNGGDGLVVARHLANRGYPVQVVLLEDPAKLKPDPLLNYSMIIKMNIPCISVNDVSEDIASGGGNFIEYCRESDLVVDAIFGTGINSPVRGIFERTILAINRSKKPVISIDIHSGLDADTGQLCGVAVKATRTVTLALPKRGLYEGNGPEYAGMIDVVDIGIPRELLLPFLK